MTVTNVVMARPPAAEDAIRVTPASKSKAFRSRYVACQVDAVRVTREDYLRGHMTKDNDLDAIFRVKLLFQDNRQHFETFFGPPSFRIQENDEVLRVYAAQFMGEQFLLVTGQKSGSFYEWVGSQRDFSSVKPKFAKFAQKISGMIATISADHVDKLRMQMR